MTKNNFFSHSTHVHYTLSVFSCLHAYIDEQLIFYLIYSRKINKTDRIKILFIRSFDKEEF